MKKLLRIIGLISISLLYCFAIGIYSGITFKADAAIVKHNQVSQDCYNASVAAKWFQHTVQSENAFTAVNYSRPAISKNTYTDHSACIKVTEQLVCSDLAQYSFYSHKLLMRVKQTDLVFHFHYFW